jgi:putative ABC transport system substrate-binding protein
MSRAETFAHLLAAFRQGLGETGYIEGQNVAIEFRWADGNVGRLPELVGELIRLQVAVIVASGSSDGGLGAKAATTAIPIVATIGSARSCRRWERAPVN